MEGTVEVLRKRLSRTLLILGMAMLPTATPGCTDASGPKCQAEGERCGTNDEPYFNCCSGLECRTFQEGDKLVHRCVDPSNPSLTDP
jgi:hypothetical protein